MFFRLLPEVYLIVGKNKSFLQNISAKKAFWIDKNIADLIKICENNAPIPAEFLEYAKELEKNKWGKITETPIFVEKLRPSNIVDTRQIHSKAPIINYATIKLTDRCNLNCNKCGKVFCPSCLKGGTDDIMDISTVKFIIKNLKNYRCKTVLLTGGEVTLIPDLKDICDTIVKSGLRVVISTNGINKLDKCFMNLDILISVFSKEQLMKIIDNYKEFNNVTVVNFFSDTRFPLLPKTWKCINRTNENHKITRKSLINMSVDRFYMRQTKNTCLSGKIVIDECGDVYPCLEAIKHQKKVGNVNEFPWEDIVRMLSEKFWNEKIDNHKICKDCEFRYACNSCFFDDVEKNCCYNLEAGMWK